ncbi:hypothetical protein [Lichenicoccus sp.]|uniref:hypothetical protein n=1 Tax=Lichenicoccus sp. TaxID=2781899 RepID=UPI003D12E715
MITRPVGADLAEAAALVTRGELAAAAALVDALLQADPADAGAWFQRARLLAATGAPADALVACRRAIDLWPDILPVCRLFVQLRERLGDTTGRDEADLPGPDLLPYAERIMLAATPDDAFLHNRIAARLCDADDPLGALPHLRIAAVALGHRDSALWNYTSALTLTGGYHELLAAEPLLRALAREVAPPFAPYVHLANAKLALHHGRDAVLGQFEALRHSARWLDASGLAALLARSIARRRPFGMVLLTQPEARMAAYASRLAGRHPRDHPAHHAGLVLDGDELSAVANSVWQGWFGATIESAGSLAPGRLGSRLLAALNQADVVGLPDAAVLTAEMQVFGFLAEMQSLVLRRPDRHFVPLGVMAALHDAMPFLRPLLEGLPFLGHVGCHPDLAERLARFCRIAETSTWLLPAPLDAAGIPTALRSGGPALERLDQVLESLVVPFEGAVFLVGAGLLGAICSAHIRQLGGIAIPVDAIMGRWMAG